MASADQIYARVRHHGANLKIKGEEIEIIRPWKLPKEAMGVIATHRDALYRFLEAKEGEFEERAAVLEIDGGLPRKTAERFAEVEVYEIVGLSPEYRNGVLAACGRIIDEELGPLWEARRAA